MTTQPTSMKRPDDSIGLEDDFEAAEAFSEDEADDSDEADGAFETVRNTRSDTELYAGDTGELPHLTRQVLVHLLKGPYFERKKSERLWEELKEKEAVIRSRLDDLFLELVIDHSLGVAFCQKANVGDLEAPSLLHTVRLRFLDSAVLLELRERLMRARADGERAVVTVADVGEMLRLFEDRKSVV